MASRTTLTAHTAALRSPAMPATRSRPRKARAVALAALAYLPCAWLGTPAMSTEVSAESADPNRSAPAESPDPNRSTPAEPADRVGSVQTESADRIRSAQAEYQERVDARQFAEALGPAKRAYDYAQQDLGIDDPVLATTAAALGTLLLELDRPVDALRPLTHALELYDHQGGRASLGSRTMQRRIAEANRRLERYETAELAWLDLVKRTKQAEGDVTGELALIYARLQLLMTDAGAHVRSRRYGLMSMKGYQQAEGEDSLAVGLVTVKLARTSLELGEWNEAIDFLDHGVPILEKRLAPGDPQLSRLYEFLVELFETAGDDGRARRYRVRLRKNRDMEAKSG